MGDAGLARVAPARPRPADETETALAETRASTTRSSGSTTTRVVYGSGEEIKAVRADGTGQPVELVAAADSPAVVN